MSLMAVTNQSKKVSAPPTSNETRVVPFKYFGAMKSLKPQYAPGKRRRYVSRSIGLKPTRVAQFSSNTVDAIDDEDILAYWKDGTLVVLRQEEVKEMILKPWLCNNVVSNLVTIKKDGTIFPGFIPDLADFALLPKPIKLVILMLFKSSTVETEPILHDLWLATSPTIPLTINETRLSLGLVKWSCFSFPSRVQLISVKKSMPIDIGIDVECDDASENPMDGRRYGLKVKVNERFNERGIETDRDNAYNMLDKDVNILVWNSQGIGRPSFLGNVQQLIRAHRPDIVILLETRLGKPLLQICLRRCFPNELVNVSPRNVYGGVAIFSTHNMVSIVSDYLSFVHMSCNVKGKKIVV